MKEVDCEADPFCRYYPECKEIMRTLPEIRDMWFRHYVYGLILKVWGNHHDDAACLQKEWPEAPA